MSYSKPQQTPQQGTHVKASNQAYNQYKGTKKSQSGSCSGSRGK